MHDEAAQAGAKHAQSLDGLTADRQRLTASVELTILVRVHVIATIDNDMRNNGRRKVKACHRNRSGTSPSLYQSHLERGKDN